MIKNIAIIGGGTLALYLLKAFVDMGNSEITLDIFEANENVGMGMPYNSLWANPEHRVNIACKELPKALEEPHVWLLQQSDFLLDQFNITRKDISSSYVFPRILFGRYQENQFFTLLNKGYQKGLKITVHTKCKIEDMEYLHKNHKVKLVINDIFQPEFNYAIIATGHEWPREKENNMPGYYDSPFPLNKLNRKFNHRVGILGSSLSAVDAIRTLARNHGSFYTSSSGKLKYRHNSDSKEFRIVMHSRRGLLPSIRYYLEHPRIRKYEYISKKEIVDNISKNNGYLSLDYVFDKSYKRGISKKDPETFKAIKNMSIEEFSHYYYERIGIFSSDPFKNFQKQLQVSRNSEKDKSPIYWREAIEDTYYTLNFHAKSLSAEDMIRLRKYLMPLYYHAVIFMPFDSAEELIALHEEDVLEITATGYESNVVVNKNGQIAVTYENKKFQYKTFIDCRGQRELRFQSFPFKTLIKQGVVSPAKVNFKKNAYHFENKLPSGLSLVHDEGKYSLKLPGVAFNDAFQTIDKFGKVNVSIHILANAYIKGLNPDLSGIPFCKDAAEIVMHTVVEDGLFKERN